MSKLALRGMIAFKRTSKDGKLKSFLIVDRADLFSVAACAVDPYANHDSPTILIYLKGNSTPAYITCTLEDHDRLMASILSHEDVLWGAVDGGSWQRVT